MWVDGEVAGGFEAESVVLEGDGEDGEVCPYFHDGFGDWATVIGSEGLKGGRDASTFLKSTYLGFRTKGLGELALLAILDCRESALLDTSLRLLERTIRVIEDESVDILLTRHVTININLDEPRMSRVTPLGLRLANLC